ncbi:hypothetical protein LSH36_75g11003 [Paralvinella palmiformis]|uniref:Uncharacterized protein n=1 Tax=Paralvinella palmiformis TaxID=53620 RepID=A0AAD9NCN4_9ANNE|nr:hypothetical protein LSH36_75g11003 [Paralvinella palmiformis]
MIEKPEKAVIERTKSRIEDRVEIFASSLKFADDVRCWPRRVVGNSTRVLASRWMELEFCQIWRNSIRKPRKISQYPIGDGQGSLPEISTTTTTRWLLDKNNGISHHAERERESSIR